jgi:RNA polymerase sigma-70 factor (ECF subfamily)
MLAARNGSDPADEALAARVARHEGDAFSALYDRYARTVYVLAAQLLGRSDAEEAVQEIFLRLWNKADQFDPARGSFAAWFISITRHYVLDQMQRRDREPAQIAQEIDEALVRQSADTDMAEQTWLRQCAAAAGHALLDLPAEQRRVIVLAYFGGQSQSEIAESLDMPLGTVKKRIRLGMQKLRAALGAQGLMPSVERGSTTGQQ